MRQRIRDIRSIYEIYYGTFKCPSQAVPKQNATQRLSGVGCKACRKLSGNSINESPNLANLCALRIVQLLRCFLLRDLSEAVPFLLLKNDRIMRRVRKSLKW